MESYPCGCKLDSTWNYDGCTSPCKHGQNQYGFSNCKCFILYDTHNYNRSITYLHISCISSGKLCEAKNYLKEYHLAYYKIYEDFIRLVEGDNVIPHYPMIFNQILNKKIKIYEQKNENFK
jgi:hypothetical protein